MIPNGRFEKTTSGSCLYGNQDDRDRFERQLPSHSLPDEAGPSGNSSRMWNLLNYCSCSCDCLRGRMVQEGRQSGRCEVHQLAGYPFFEDPLVWKHHLHPGPCFEMCLSCFDCFRRREKTLEGPYCFVQTRILDASVLPYRLLDLDCSDHHESLWVLHPCPYQMDHCQVHQREGRL